MKREMTQVSKRSAGNIKAIHSSEPELKPLIPAAFSHNEAAFQLYERAVTKVAKQFMVELAMTGAFDTVSA